MSPCAYPSQHVCSMILPFGWTMRTRPCGLPVFVLTMPVYSFPPVPSHCWHSPVVRFGTGLSGVALVQYSPKSVASSGFILLHSAVSSGPAPTGTVAKKFDGTLLLIVESSSASYAASAAGASSTAFAGCRVIVVFAINLFRSAASVTSDFSQSTVIFAFNSLTAPSKF